jgi:hypothetical protein
MKECGRETAGRGAGGSEEGVDVDMGDWVKEFGRV